MGFGILKVESLSVQEAEVGYLHAQNLYLNYIILV